MPRCLEPTDATIAEAAAALEAGGAVVFPTETVYGLGADTSNPVALRRVYELKGRPADNPLIAHVLDADMARLLTNDWNDRAAALAAAFWPGPLTIVLSRSANVPREATGGYATIAIRSPRHPVARALIEKFGRPISAPSANRSGRVSPTCVAHVMADFANEDDLIVLEGGASDLGIESTVVDLAGLAAVILRPGSVTASMLADVLDEPVEVQQHTGQAASPGTRMSHYAPRTRAELLAGAAISEALSRLHGRGIVLTIGKRVLPAPHMAITMPRDPAAYAARLYAALREADEADGDLIIIERPAERSESWQAVLNRLERAAIRDA